MGDGLFFHWKGFYIMKKKLYITLLVLLLCINISGCGKTENINNSNKNSSDISSNVTENNNSSQNINTKETPSTDNSTILEETIAPKFSELPEQVVPTQSSEPERHKLSASQQYSDIYRAVKVLGLKEYKKIKSEKYIDKAKKGKKFLVLFLSVKNDTNKEDYINYNYISAKVDGKKIEHTFLLNDPKGYPTIFSHVPANEGIGGFIVWEVPSVWKTLEFEYNGWKDINNISLEAKFTKDDLSDPVIYNANDFK